FQHQAKRFVHQLVGATRGFFGKHIHRENRHGAADYNHVLTERLNLWREKLVLQIQLVHHIAHHAGEQLTLDDVKKFGVRLPELRRSHWARASLIFSAMARASRVIDAKSPFFAPAVRLPPTPTATAPARIQSATFSRLTPPVGINDACGRGALTALTNAGPRSSPGKTFTMSAPHSMAWTTSPTVPAPGM